jgi:hypothetical protein
VRGSGGTMAVFDAISRDRRLDIVSDFTGADQYIGLNASDYLTNSIAMPFVIKNGGVERLRITSGGSVGIGTTTPTSPLTVAGTIESSSGGYKFPDGTVQIQAVNGATAAYASSVQGADVSSASLTLVDVSTLAPVVIAVKNGDIVKADLQCNGYNISNYVVAQLVLSAGAATTLAAPNFQYSYNPSANWNALNSQGLFQATATGNLTFRGQYKAIASGTGFINGCSLIAVRIGH